MALLQNSTFLLVGVGGLGSPLVLALLASGAGRVRLVDDDVVELSNLQRQILYRTRDVGRPKVDAARDALLRRGFGASRVEAVRTRFDAQSAQALLADVNVVVEGSDDVATKFFVNDRCVAAGLPFVIAGVLRDSGQVFPVRPGVDACYRCLFEAPPKNAGLTCADAGVFGATCAQVAARQAQSAMALATGQDAGGASLFSLGHFRAWRPAARPDCKLCAPSSHLLASNFELAIHNP